MLHTIPQGYILQFNPTFTLEAEIPVLSHLLKIE
jgi:hypothetical protein